MSIASWQKALSDIRQAVKSMGGSTVWFRGVPDMGYSLTPSLIRYPNGTDCEQELYERYRQLQKRIDPSRSKTGWELLCDMQHHSVPTRLLDWTTVLGVAVYFACAQSKPNQRAARIYILDPIALNKASMDSNRVIDVARDSSLAYEKCFFQRIGPPLKTPFAIDPPFASGRVLAQRGQFTAHGTQPEPLESQFPSLVKHVDIPNPARVHAREFLAEAGVDHLSMFPDIFGVAPFLTELVGLH